MVPKTVLQGRLFLLMKNVWNVNTDRVGSANFSQRKIGHAHDNSADSENGAGAHQRSVHAHFIFRFENGPGNQSFCSIHDQNTAETSQPQAQPTDDWRAMNRACPWGLKRPLEEFDSARLSQKKKKKEQANFVNRRKLLLKGYNFKESKHDRFGKRPAANSAEKIDERSTEVDVSAFCRSIGWIFFLQSSKNFRFAFLALNVSSQYFTWKISICSAKSNHVLRCSLSGELATGRARLRTGDRVAASQLQLTEVNRKSSAFSSAGFVRRLESRSWKVRLGLQSYSICRGKRKIEKWN